MPQQLHILRLPKVQSRYGALSQKPECFGSEVRYFDGEVPTIFGKIVSEMADAENLAVPEVGSGRTGIYIDAVKQAVDLLEDRPLLAGVIGPFSLAGRLMDVTDTMMNCFQKPDMVHKVLEKAVEFQIKYINAYKAAGANGVVMAEPLAGVLSPKMIVKFSETYVKKIIDAVQDENFIVIYHNCGDYTTKMLDSIARVGASGYHFGNKVDLAEIIPQMPKDVLVMGNVDPSSQFQAGTPESIKKATKEVMAKCYQYTNFVISSGCDIPPTSPWENIDAFFEAAEEFYAENA